jgi:hypothetical protein
MPPNAWSRRTAVGLVLLAAVLSLTARLIAGPRGALVHVRWQPSITAAEREGFERRFRLTQGEPLDAGTWRYDLVDPSGDNISALVSEPAAADTHNIVRASGALDPAAVRTSRRSRFAGGDAMVAIADRLAATLALLGVALVLGGALARTAAAQAAMRRSRRSADLIHASILGPIARFLQRGIPQIDARTAGIFRIVFGSAALAYFVLYPVDSSWLARTFDLEIEGPVHQAVMQWLRARPVMADLVMPWLIVTGLAFIAGLFTQVTYALFVAGALVWAYIAVSLSSTHPQSILVLTLVALLPSRWGDGVSIDAWRSANAGRSIARAAGSRYGYSVWVPVLVFGVAFAAAAWAKLTVPPGWTSWIVNGTVKYHFITDSVNAPVQVGLQLAAHPWLAVLASFIAIAIESMVVTAAFVRNEWYRLTMGLGAVALIAGFGLFMGVFWPGWWVPLLGFLPWRYIFGDRAPRIGNRRPAVDDSMPNSRSLIPNPQSLIPDPRSPIPDPRSLLVSGAQLAMIVAVIAQQIVVSANRLERAPMFSWYDMYSGTYANPAAFAASRPPRYRIVASTPAGTVEVGGCNPHEEFVRQFEAAIHGSPQAQADVWEALRDCGDLTAARTITLEGDVSTFDFDRLQFTTTRSARIIGPLTRAHADASDR